MDNLERAKILIIDDEEPIRNVLAASLQDEGYEVKAVANGELGLEHLPVFRPDVILLDIWMPGSKDGMVILGEIASRRDAPAVIMMSGHGTIETAVKATKMGAWDFLEKPLSMDKVSILIQNVLNYRIERQEKQALLNKLRTGFAIIGDHPSLVQIKHMITRVATSNSWVLITGENGTGKELVAQNLHYLSSRASQAFVEVNCAAIPEDLIESELFGYEKGAFTGANQTKKGKFDLAHGGTLLLDEIGDMSQSAQAKVLRFLQERKFTRVGGNQEISVDVRVIAATNKNLEEEIAAGRFREDLYYRLNVIPFHMPALRERASDIPALVIHFSEQFAREGGYTQKQFGEAAMGALMEYSWPGNVRELRNFIERIYILTPSDTVELHDIRFAGLPDTAEMATDFVEITNFREARARFEREYLVKKIQENNGNISRTAETIGLERSYLHRKIKSYNIDFE